MEQERRTLRGDAEEAEPREGTVSPAVRSEENLAHDTVS